MIGCAPPRPLGEGGWKLDHKLLKLAGSLPEVRRIIGLDITSAI